MSGVALVACLFGGYRLHHSLTANIEQDAWIGWTEKDLLARLGKPDQSHAGRIRPDNETEPDDPRDRSPRTPVRTLVFKTRWGWLYIWLQPGGDGWACHESLWFGHNLRF
jgi:hypothetical protein